MDDDFSEEERRDIRKLIEDDRRARWAWKQARIWATWISAGIIGVIATYDAVSRFVRGIMK